MLHRDALIAHFVLLGWEPVKVVRYVVHAIAMLNGANVMYIDSDWSSRQYGSVRFAPAELLILVQDRRSGWDEFSDHQLREFYRALDLNRSPA
ncbi:TPA: hypothetical protein QDE31_37525 [Burkholderia cenocepacia]|uniref:hypothetical protein n=1 Tax=Burkholderia cenocepacia TaxID=95486 RepID=UPI002ABE43C5|nr:hypothetical protein [Burkholderia cenocepacia]HDR9868513.1 hypothetical protein [Burkholderia cenocepacia]HDR9875407.1 hypothetical protein [Burkholderia cenocepacia]